MTASQFLIDKLQGQPNQVYIFGDIQRIESEYTNRTNDELQAPTGTYKDGVVDKVYSKMREYMVDEFTTQKEREVLAEMMNQISYPTN